MIYNFLATRVFKVFVNATIMFYSRKILFNGDSYIKYLAKDISNSTVKCDKCDNLNLFLSEYASINCTFCRMFSRQAKNLRGSFLQRKYACL